MAEQIHNYAFIDSQNLNLATQSLGWNVDWIRFRAYLAETYQVSKAYMFIGFMPENQELYDSLTKAGYELIYKPVMVYKDGTVKGNIDAELVLQVMVDIHHYSQAVIVTGDGDFYCLINFLHNQNKLKTLLVPNHYRFSSLLKDAAKDNIVFLNNLRHKLEYKRRRNYKKPAQNNGGEQSPQAEHDNQAQPAHPAPPPQNQPSDHNHQSNPLQSEPPTSH